jgi:hypothetical protein
MIRSRHCSVATTHTARDVDRAVPIGVSDCFDVMDGVMKFESPIAFGFTECSGRRSSASKLESSSTENALVPCPVVSRGLSSIREFSGLF